MKNIIVGLISGAIGVVTGFIIKDAMYQKVEKTKEFIDSTLDNNPEEIFDRIDDPVQKRAFVQKYCDMVKEGYHSTKDEDVMKAYTDLQNFIRDVIVLTNDEIEENIDYEREKELEENLDRERGKELFISYMKSLGIQINNPETKELKSVLVNEEKHVEKPLIHPVKITVDEANRYKEVDENGEDISTTDTEDISEIELETEPETDMEEELPKEEQSIIQPQEVVPVKEEVAITEDCEDNVDDEKFTTLLRYFVKPLLDRYGDDYEDRLLKMIELLSRTTTDVGTYDTYTTKLKAIVNYHKDDEKGKRKLNNVISNFFSMYPSDSDQCEE